MTPNENSARFDAMLAQLSDRIDSAEQRALDLEHQAAAEQRAEEKRAAERREAVRALFAERGARYAGCRIATFACPSPEHVVIRDAVQQFADNLEQHILAGHGLLLFGPSGVGKDHLLAALMRLAIEQGQTVKWIAGVSLFSALRDLMDRGGSERSFLASLTRPDVLAISDPLPPTGGLSDYQRAKMLEIIDARYSAARPSWFTANVAGREEADARIGVAIVDRMVDQALCLPFNLPTNRRPL